MEPTVGPGPRVVALAPARAGARGVQPHDTWLVWVLACALVVAVVGIGVALVARGEPLPPIVPTVALVVVLAVTVNRGAFFPTELVATAEAAVLFAALVGFSRDAAFLGPLIVAFAVGPLDVVHWRQRAVVRMAYNSGSQGLAVLVGAAAFRAASEAFGGSFPAVVAAAAVAAVPYALVDSTCGVLLMLARGGSRLRDAVRHQWSLNGLAIPLGCVGALAGFLVIDVGWWLGILVILPMPWIPELVLVRARSAQRSTPGTRVRVLGGSTIGAAITVATIVAWSSGTHSLPVVVVFAVVLGAEMRVSASRAIPPLAAAAVVAAVIVDGSDSAFGHAAGGVLVTAGLVGATVTATSWVLARDARVVRASLAILGAAIGGALCGVAVVAAPNGGSLLAEVSSVVLGAALFAGLAVLFNGPRSEAWMSVAWTAPVILVAVLLASAWRVLGTPGAFVFVAGVGVALAGPAWVAAPAWDSRFLGHAGARHRCRARGMVVAASVTALALACTASRVESGRGRTSYVLVAAALVEMLLAVSLGAVRQWRFAPAPRARSATALGVLAALVVAVYVPLAYDGTGWSVPVLGALLVAVGAIVWPLARLTDSVVVTR